MAKMGARILSGRGLNEGRLPWLGAAAIAAWLVAWQVASSCVASPLLLPGPLAVLASLLRLCATPEFWQALASSAANIAGGAAAGYALALALAGAAHASTAVRALAQPPLAAIKGTPIACIVVLLLIWFGSEHVSAAAVFLLVVPGIYFPVLEALERQDERACELFACYGAAPRISLLAKTWPRILPHLAAASRTVLGMSWKAGVAAELIGTPAMTVGERIYQAKLLLETADLFAWTIAVVLVAWSLERLALLVLEASWPACARLAARTSPGPARRRDEEAGCAAARTGRGSCVVGPSGAGKTTWLRRAGGLPTHLDGRGGARTPVAAWVFQEQRLVEELTAVQNVTLLAGARSMQEARRILVELGLQDCLDRPVSQLSGGQRRRVELARALAAPCGPLILDEPLAGLDEAARRSALAVIDRHRAGRTVLMAAHDAADAAALDLELVAPNDPPF